MSHTYTLLGHKLVVEDFLSTPLSTALWILAPNFPLGLEELFEYQEKAQFTKAQGWVMTDNAECIVVKFPTFGRAPHIETNGDQRP